MMAMRSTHGSSWARERSHVRATKRIEYGAGPESEHTTYRQWAVVRQRELYLAFADQFLRGALAALGGRDIE